MESRYCITFNRTRLPTEEGFSDPTIENESKEKETPSQQGKLILDATVVEQAIRYLTDLSLLNEAREFSEQIIDKLYPQTKLKR